MAEFTDHNQACRFRDYVINPRHSRLNKESMDFLKTIEQCCNHHTFTIGNNLTFFRALINDEPKPPIHEEILSKNKRYTRERMTPSSEYCLDSRANRKGDVCLYAASTKETAIAEVRPWINNEINIAEVTPKGPLTIVDFTPSDKNPDSLVTRKTPRCSSIESSNFHWIGYYFCKPVERGMERQYKPTQIISKYAKEWGYDGVAYRSRLSNDGGYNLAIFNPDNARITDTIYLTEVQAILIQHRGFDTFF
jgi:hypothetical protein